MRSMGLLVELLWKGIFFFKGTESPSSWPVKIVIIFPHYSLYGMWWIRKQRVVRKLQSPLFLEEVCHSTVFSICFSSSCLIKFFVYCIYNTQMFQSFWQSHQFYSWTGTAFAIINNHSNSFNCINNWRDFQHDRK